MTQSTKTERVVIDIAPDVSLSINCPADEKAIVMQASEQCKKMLQEMGMHTVDKSKIPYAVALRFAQNWLRVLAEYEEYKTSINTSLEAMEQELDDNLR